LNPFAPAAETPDVTPSPLNGLRAKPRGTVDPFVAGVTGENVWKHLALASIALLSIPAQAANPAPASVPIAAVRPLGFSPFNAWAKPLNPTSFAPTAIAQPKSADPTQLPPANPSYTQGRKTLLYIRIRYPDDPTESVTEDQAYAF